MLNVLCVGFDTDKFNIISRYFGHCFTFNDYNELCCKIIDDKCKKDIIVVNKDFFRYSAIKDLVELITKLCYQEPLIIEVNTTANLKNGVESQLLTSLVNNVKGISLFDSCDEFITLNQIYYLKSYKLSLEKLSSKFKSGDLLDSTDSAISYLDKMLDSSRDKLNNLTSKF